MHTTTQRVAVVSALLCVSSLPSATAQEVKKEDLASALVLQSTFDSVCDLNLSSGSGRIYTAETLARKKIREGNHRNDAKIVKNAGKFGDALHFEAVSKQVLFYRADELYIPKQDWSTTFSFWLKLDPNKDLEPGYCDPLQMTEKQWNDAAMFVDFDQDLPRDFRLGVFSDYERWNPKDTPWDQIPADKRPLVTVKTPPFSKDAWTHVVFTLDNANPADGSEGTAVFYLNGQHQGTLRQPMQFSWDQDKAAIMLGINYIGFFDDMAIFNRALTADEVLFLHKLPEGVNSLK
jgi:hypothetical protein